MDENHSQPSFQPPVNNPESQPAAPVEPTQTQAEPVQPAATPEQQPAQPTTEGPKKTSGWAIAAIMCSFIFFPLGIILGIVALMVIGKNKNLKGKGLAIVSIVLSLLFMILLPILMIIGSLAYFGVLNPTALLPEKCNMEIGMECADYMIDADQNQVLLKLINGRGRTLYISEINVKDQNGVLNSCSWRNPEGLTLENGLSNEFAVQCANVNTANEMVRADITLTYWNEGSTKEMSREMQGELLTKVY